MKQLLRISWPLWAWKWTCSSSIYQAQASDQFLATNRAICLKIIKVNKSKMDFRKFPATNNRYISVIPHSAYWIDIWAYKKYSCPPFSTIQSWYLTHYCGPKVQRISHRHSCVVPDIGGHVLVKLWGPLLGSWRREIR
jgi:hypothetical protein